MARHAAGAEGLTGDTAQPGEAMADQRPRYEPVDHPADAGIRAFGRNLAELFENAAYGLFDTITDPAAVMAVETRTIVLESAELEDLMVLWLGELNYIFQTEQMLFAGFEIGTVSAQGLTAEIKGEKLDHGRHGIRAEVKAVTYHDLRILQGSDGWEAKVIFDL